MADVTEDLGKAIIAGGYASAEGTDLFYGVAPSSPDNVVCLACPSGGMPREPTTTVMYPSVQVYIRNTNYSTAQTKGTSIISLLDQTTTTTRNGRVYYYIEAQQSLPNYLGTDENGRHEFTVNFTVVCEV